MNVNMGAPGLYHGSLCTEMYEFLHCHASEEELAFYLAYAKEGMRILEPLCGSGRFLIPFMQRGFDIQGVDSSREMLEKLRRKAPDAHVVQCDIMSYRPSVLFDYAFVASSSMSLFTEVATCRSVLATIRRMLKPDGILVFGVDTVACKHEDDADYRLIAIAPMPESRVLTLRSRNRYEKETQTQFSPGLYELKKEDKVLQSETMDFQTHLYRFGEMENLLADTGFSDVKTYRSFSKEKAVDSVGEMFLFECRASARRA